MSEHRCYLWWCESHGPNGEHTTGNIAAINAILIGSGVCDPPEPAMTIAEAVKIAGF